MLEDERGNVWISTNKGISKLPTSANRIRNYDVGDGLQSNEFNQWAFFKSQSGEMFFGGINGVTSFFPDSLHDNPHIPPIVLTSLKVSDKEKDLAEACSDSKPVQLSYKDNSFSFEFAALDYTRPEKNRYAYMLEGFDADWIYSGARRYASYTNLDPGYYTLHLKGSNNDAVWNERGFSVRIWIAPPFWMTWWFRSGALLFLFSSATLSYVFRMRAIQKQNRILEQKIAEATAELNTTNECLQSEVLERKRSEDELWRYKQQLEEQVLERTAQLSQTVSSLKDQIAGRVLAEQSLVAYQEKLRALAFDLCATEERERRRLSRYLHDSIGQTLAFCKIKLQSFQRSSRRTGSDNRVREIQDMIEKSITETRKLTLELSPPILHELGLVPAIEWLCKRFQAEHQIQFSINADSRPLSLDQDLSNLLFHATREVIVNIIKHAEAKNAIVNVHQDRDYICVEIRDDGCGFDPQSMQDNIKERDAFGLFSVRERLHSLGGRMEIVSNRGSGTNVKLILQNRPTGVSPG
jgi:signal transduction histidine kinase